MPPKSVMIMVDISNLTVLFIFPRLVYGGERRAPDYHRSAYPPGPCYFSIPFLGYVVTTRKLNVSVGTVRAYGGTWSRDRDDFGCDDSTHTHSASSFCDSGSSNLGRASIVSPPQEYSCHAMLNRNILGRRDALSFVFIWVRVRRHNVRRSVDNR